MRNPLLNASAKLFLISCISVSAAFGHAVLTESTPSEGESIARTQNEIYLKFSEAVESRFSNFKLDSEDGGNALSLAAVVDPTDRKVVLIHLPQPLKSGRYYLEWKVTTADTHRVEGKLSFLVK